MSVERSRIAILAGLATIIIRGPGVFAAPAEALPTATVYKSPT